MTSGVAAVLPLSPQLLLGLEHGMTAPAAAAQMAALAQVAPQMAEHTAAALAATALRVIEAGHPDPARLARHTLIVCRAAHPPPDGPVRPPADTS